MVLITNRDQLWDELGQLGIPFRERVGVLTERYQSEPHPVRKDHAPRYLITDAERFVASQTEPFSFVVTRSTRLDQPVVVFETVIYRVDDPTENIRLVTAELKAKLGGDPWEGQGQTDWSLQPSASISLRYDSPYPPGCRLLVMAGVPRTLEPRQLAVLASYEPMWTKSLFRRAPLPEALEDKEAGFGFADADQLFVFISADADVIVIERSDVQAVVVDKIIDGRGGPGGGLSGAAFLYVHVNGRSSISLSQGAGDSLDRLAQKLAKRLDVPFKVTTSPDS